MTAACDSPSRLAEVVVLRMFPTCAERRASLVDNWQRVNYCCTMPTTSHEPQRFSDRSQLTCTRLLELTVQRDHFDSELRTRVREAREAGVTWAAIGSILGMTRQGAQQFYGDGGGKA